MTNYNKAIHFTEEEIMPITPQPMIRPSGSLFFLDFQFLDSVPSWDMLSVFGEELDDMCGGD